MFGLFERLVSSVRGRYCTDAAATLGGRQVDELLAVYNEQLARLAVELVARRDRSSMP